ncbi:MAG: NAD(P)/FAD-dependent oxidoreductase [Alphaproteobacteria bacterium]|nr:NAD(P)/FAD-dependent oxidoreductase [Alphaproteobacteria bacterium]
MTDHVDTIVIGAGVIGLACARALALAGHEVVVLEAATTIGTGISTRNSEVIHAGIYYPADSLKAELCVRGKAALYDYCEATGVPHKRLGKLIVATEEAELETLAAIADMARANGVDDLERIEPDRLARLEPELRAAGALMSPSTGIIDAAALMLALQGDAQQAGAMIAFASPVTGGDVGESTIALEVGGDSAMTIACNRLVNAGGLDAPAIARTFTGLAAETLPPTRLAKGTYFTLTGKSPFSHLIYPVPVAGGLGTHSTLDLGGATKFGPDVEWVETRDVGVDEGRAPSFYDAVRRFWPGLPDGALAPAYAGIRPKLAGPGETNGWGSDFVIQGPDAHGIAGLVNLYGIESPGLTACLAIAERVTCLVTS